MIVIEATSCHHIIQITLKLTKCIAIYFRSFPPRKRLHKALYIQYKYHNWKQFWQYFQYREGNHHSYSNFVSSLFYQKYFHFANHFKEFVLFHGIYKFFKLSQIKTEEKCMLYFLGDLHNYKRGICLLKKNEISESD